MKKYPWIGLHSDDFCVLFVSPSKGFPILKTGKYRYNLGVMYDDWNEIVFRKLNKSLLELANGL